jgi:ABC-type transport system substrate-binding protein
MNSNNEKSVINFCFSNPWRNLHPGTQNTLIGGVFISQQFESLVKIDSNGNIAPLIAKTWKISDDFKKITFNLDENKKFNNGKNITTDDVFKSWVKSFNMSKEGPNNSLKDVLYNIVGFDKGKKFDQILGLKKINELSFEINFKDPFRLAIYHLRGARFSIYTEEENQIIGSGPFSFNIDNSNNSIIVKNKNTNKIINVIHDESVDKPKLLKEGACDLVYVSAGSAVKLESNENIIEHIESEDAVHLILNLNSKNGIFSDIKMRKAFLYLIHSNKENSNLFIENPLFGNVDAQIYNKFSQGRLEDSESQNIINEGEKWLPLFLQKISSEKLSFLSTRDDQFENAFEKIKISKFLNRSKCDLSCLIGAIYKGNLSEDFTTTSLSVISFDPDGIYHALGRHGAILNPYASSETLFNLLEEGRKITDLSKIDEHYRQVSRAFLEEVPFIHLGFSKSVLLYNKNRVSISKDNFRNTLDFNDFIEK